MKLTKKQLQKTLDDLAKYNSLAFDLAGKIDAHCRTVYGYDPGSVDNDEFIDRVGGGHGSCDGMTVEDLDRSMKHAIEMSKSTGHIR